MVSFGEILVLFMLAGSGGPDLLHFVPTDQYWKSHQVEVTADAMLAEICPPSASQPDISDLVGKLGDRAYKVRVEAHAKLKAMGRSIAPAIEKAMADPPNEEARLQMKELLGEFTGAGTPRAAARLMAIRTLGELKDAKALPVLRGLAESKVPFEAEYARVAIAAIEGKPAPKLVRPSSQPTRDDLWLLPKNCGVVGQASLAFDTKLDLDTLIASLVPPGGPDEAAAQAKAQVVKGLIEAADRVGNIRLDGVTFGVADDVGNESGFAVLVVRGLCDRATVKAFVKEMANEGNNPLARMKVETIEGVDVISEEEGGNGYFILPSDDRVIMVVGPPGEKLPRKDMLAAVKAGKGGLADNADMVKLIGSVDPAASVWAVMKVSKAYAAAPVLAPFNDLVAEARIKSGLGERNNACMDALEGEIKVSKGKLVEVEKKINKIEEDKDFAQFRKTRDEMNFRLNDLCEKAAAQEQTVRDRQLALKKAVSVPGTPEGAEEVKKARSDLIEVERLRDDINKKLAEATDQKHSIDVRAADYDSLFKDRNELQGKIQDFSKKVSEMNTVLETAEDVKFSLKARGTDADEVAKAVEVFNSGLKEAKDGIAGAVQMMPALKPVADLLDTVKVKTDGANVSVTAEFKGGITKLLGLPGMMFMGRTSAPARMNAPAPAMQRNIPPDPS